MVDTIECHTSVHCSLWIIYLNRNIWLNVWNNVHMPCCAVGRMSWCLRPWPGENIMSVDHQQQVFYIIWFGGVASLCVCQVLDIVDQPLHWWAREAGGNVMHLKLLVQIAAFHAILPRNWTWPRDISIMYFPNMEHKQFSHENNNILHFGYWMIHNFILFFFIYVQRCELNMYIQCMYLLRTSVFHCNLLEFRLYSISQITIPKAERVQQQEKNESISSFNQMASSKCNKNVQHYRISRNGRISSRNQLLKIH